MASPDAGFGGMVEPAFEDEETPRRRGSVRVFYGNRGSDKAADDPRISFLMERMATLDARLSALEARGDAVDTQNPEDSENDDAT